MVGKLEVIQLGICGSVPTSRLLGSELWTTTKQCDGMRISGFLKRPRFVDRDRWFWVTLSLTVQGLAAGVGRRPSRYGGALAARAVPSVLVPPVQETRKDWLNRDFPEIERETSSAASHTPPPLVEIWIRKGAKGAVVSTKAVHLRDAAIKRHSRTVFV